MSFIISSNSLGSGQIIKIWKEHIRNILEECQNAVTRDSKKLKKKLNSLTTELDLFAYEGQVKKKHYLFRNWLMNRVIVIRKKSNQAGKKDWFHF